MITRSGHLFFAFALLAACGETPGTHSRQNSLACRAPSTVSAQPRSIEQTVQLINALPKPLTLPCFIEALGRPLPLHASLSNLSAQPAVGTRSPRVFIYLEPLVLSVVPEGIGAHLLEFGEQRPAYRSLKGELEFPIEAQVPAASPYEQVRFNETLTNCAFCHATEERDVTVGSASAYVSQSLRPLDRHRVPLVNLYDEAVRCDAALEPERCELLHALFDGGTTDWNFPPEMGTFGG